MGIAVEKYSKLDTLRHSCAHVMAHAIKDIYPEAKFGIGPPVENGFFYDVELSATLSDEDLARIENRMSEIIKANEPFEKIDIPRDSALEKFKDFGETYKLEIISQINPEESISTFSEGGFTDLCRGPHVAATGAIQAFKLLHVAGAYWRGNENNPMMQRVYGTAFFSPKELKSYLAAREEAKKRDHRKLGKSLDLFSIQEEAGPGLIFYHPKGAMLRYLIEKFVREEHLKREYDFVVGPQILKSDVWKTSGHYDYYKENMFIHEAEDGREYGIKPMNCPGHMLIYKTQTRSYRDFPIRFFELGNVCRNEKSGALHGLLRVRNFTQDDAHIFCLPEQLEAEIKQVLDFVFFILKSFGFNDFTISLSTRPDKAIGSDEMWEKATDALKSAMDGMGLEYDVDVGGGAFYGPKIDLQIKDALGRAWQCSTIQCDFALPEKFELEYVSAEGKRERPVMLHRAILGSVERFMGTLIEHYSGAFPFWLAPEQIAILPVATAHEGYCEDVKSKLQKVGYRCRVLDSSETLGKRIRLAQSEKIPFTLVCGDKEVESGAVTLRLYASKDQVQLSFDELLNRCTEEALKL
ncbi:MAG: threonyl-tRNA synthetase [Candidatus Omnitrophota bacterium]|jgi:threonyl-tRNA synthetase